MKSYVVIPAYNEEKTIEEIVKKSTKHHPTIVVDDGSADNTARLAKKAGAIVVTHEKNKGYGRALFDGIKEAMSHDAVYIITLDSDGQHNPDDIPKFVEKLDEGYDIVSGSRFLSKRGWGTWKRTLAIKMLTYQTYIFSGVKLTDVQSGFRGYNTRIFEEIKLRDPGMGFSVELPIKAKKLGFTFTEVPIVIGKPYAIKSLGDALKQGIGVGKAIIKHSMFSD
jgi:glycosyltransferase involved in cell wall biosynthesis